MDRVSRELAGIPPQQTYHLLEHSLHDIANIFVLFKDAAFRNLLCLLYI